MIDWVVYCVFLLAVGFGAWVQATSGFALGLIVMALVQVTGVLSIADTAAAISVLAFINVAVALFDTYKNIDKRLFLCLVIGQLPAIGLGVALLNTLEREHTAVIGLIFGIFLIAGSISLAVDPKTKSTRSGVMAITSVGFAGGIFGGMFAASGPVVGWFAYQQPLTIVAIRASLLAMLGVTTISRTMIVATDGIFTTSLLLLTLASIPVVFATTYVAKRFPLNVSDYQFRKLIFSCVLVVGCWITVTSLIQMLH